MKHKLAGFSVTVVVMSVVGCAGPKTSVSADPKTFVSQAGSFSVRFPCAPGLVEETDDTVDRMPGKVFSHSKNQATYSVGFCDLPRASPDREKTKRHLEEVARNYAAGRGDKLLASRAVEVSGYPGHEVQFEAADPKEQQYSEERYRIYLVQARLYHLSVTGPTGGTTSGEAEQFFSSFKIKD